MSIAEPGPRDHLITQQLERELRAVPPEFQDVADLDAAEAAARLARHAMDEIRPELGDGEESADEKAKRVNALLTALAAEAAEATVALPARVLQGIRQRSPLGAPLPLPPPPASPLGQSDLLVNAKGQPNIGSELRAELATAERVDLICAFVIWSGVRHLCEAREGVVDRAHARGSRPTLALQARSPVSRRLA